MPQLIYTPDEDVKVHEENAIKLICSAFQSHESGLPEWLKNSADAYAREDAPEPRRVIVVIFDYGRKGHAPSISCLDFSGMTSAVIEESFRIWADPEAARRGARSPLIQGGHGNGGKCYMTQMFEDYALIHTVKRRIGNRYGVVAGSVRFGYIPDRNRGRDFSAPHLESELERVLQETNCSISVLPKSAQQAIQLADGFTLTTGVHPRGYSGKISVQHLVDSLQEHPQMTRTLEFCKIYIVARGELFNKGRALSLSEIEPIEGASAPRTISIPSVLRDPLSEEEVSTTRDGSLHRGILTLLTSKVSMRYGKKGRHNVIFKAQSGYIGYVPVTELDVQSPYRDRIYGECLLQSLEAYKQNERARLSNSPLSRAVERFISDQVQKYAQEFEARERKQYAKTEKDAISRINEALDRWKNRFLGELMRGMWGGPGVGPPPPRPPLPVGKPERLEVTLTHSKAGIGVSFRPTLKFYDANRQHIRPVPFRWVSEDPNTAMVDEDLSVVNTFAPGRTLIYAETLDGLVISNKVPLEVVRIERIRISPDKLEVHVGSRQKLEAICRLASGEETSGVYLVWTESNPEVVRVSAAGLIFGFTPGQSDITAGDDRCLAKDPAIVTVLAAQSDGKGDKRGKGFPLVLISGEIDTDPETHQFVHFSSEDPPVAQRPQDVNRNIWWINSAAPLARMYLNSESYGYESREWRMYHLERYIDVIVQIALTHGPTDKESLSVGEWIIRWGAKATEIQAAAVADLNNFISTGELPIV